MAKKKKLPELRFNNFLVEWEERSLESLSSLITKGTSPLDKKSDGTINFVKIENISDLSGEISISSKITLVEHEGYLKRSQLHEDDILFSIAGTLGRVSIVKKDILPANTNQALAIIRLKYGNIKYVTTFLKGRAVSEFVKRNPTVGAQPNLSLEQVGNLKVFLPHEEEQAKIGNFFKSLDSLITLQLLKHDKLCELKRAMLDKMFCKDYKQVPSIRFIEYSVNWNENSLSNYLGTSTEKNVSTKFCKDDVLSVSGEVGIVNQIKYQGRSFAGASVANYGVVHNGDVVYTKSPLKANPYGIIKTNRGKVGIVSTLYAVYKVKKSTSSSFVEYYFNHVPRLNSYLMPLVNKGAKNDMKITSDNALLGKVKFPSTLQEQMKIATFFEKLDSLICLQKLEIEKLKEIKKACLEKMFV